MKDEIIRCEEGGLIMSLFQTRIGSIEDKVLKVATEDFENPNFKTDLNELKRIHTYNVIKKIEKQNKKRFLRNVDIKQTKCMSGCKKENMYVGVWEKEYLYRCEKENIYVTVWERELASKEISLGIQFTGNEKTPMKRVKNQLVATTAIAIPNSSKCFLTSTKCFSTKTSNMSKSTIEAAFFILFCFEIEETNFDFTCYPKICCNILEQHLHILILKPKNKLLRVNSIINNHISCSTFFLVQKFVQKFGKKG